MAVAETAMHVKNRAAEAALTPSGRSRTPHGVLLVHAKSEIGGSDVSLLCLLRNLDRTRFRPVVVVPARGPLTAEYEKLCRRVLITPLCVPRSTANPVELARVLLRLVSSAWKLCKIVRDERISLVHTNSMVALTGPLVAWLKRVPSVTHIREIVVSHPLIAAGILRFVCALSRRVIAITDAVRRNLPGKWPDSDRVIVVNNGVDTNEFTPDADGEALRIEWGVRREAPVVGIVGRVAKCKGIHVFLEMIPKVLREVPKARFVVVGRAPTAREAQYEGELRRRADALGLNGTVKFCGARRDMPQVMAALEVLVLASVDPEAMGRVLIEAMACGKAVVATDHGGPAEVVEDGVTGILVPPSNPEAMARAVSRLLNDPGLRQEMGRRGRDRAVEKYSLQQYVRGIEGVYTSLLRRAEGTHTGGQTHDVMRGVHRS